MALALDGSGQGVNASGGNFTIPLTTTGGSGVIVVVGVAAADPQVVSSVTAAGLTFTQRITFDSGTNNYSFVAPYTSNFSGNITVAIGNDEIQFSSGIAFGISGAPASSYFDTNGSLPAQATLAAVSGTTSEPNDFVFCFYSTNDNTVTQGSGWTLIQDSSNYVLAQYQIGGTPGTFTGNISDNTKINAGLMDAIIAGSGGGGSTTFASIATPRKMFLKPKSKFYLR
jgi:hypothetical protein